LEIKIPKMDIQNLLSKFYSLYGKDGGEVHIYFAPGRVNLIGEHTDYNAGKVFPMAIDAGTYLLIRENTSSKLSFTSENFSARITLEKDQLNKLDDGVWVNYPLGILNEFKSSGKTLNGFDAYYAGNIPPAAGLSSSASIEMVTAFATNQLLDAGYNTLDLVNLCKKSENDFIGVNCGIMDMFAIGFGKKNHAIALNCDTLDFDYAPLELKNLCFVVSNTNKKRGLADSKYNERVRECEEAVKVISKVKDINNLSELNLKDFREVEHLFSDPIIKKRAYHIVSENYRVDEALKALKENNIKMFGKLMNASHVSLQDNYEVTGTELDALVKAAQDLEGVIGSRMTGAGFGGCTISLVEAEKLDEFYEQVTTEYKKKTGLIPVFYVFKASNGVREIELN
jgi:galactokinase